MENIDKFKKTAVTDRCIFLSNLIYKTSKNSSNNMEII